MDDAIFEADTDGYTAPALTDFGTIEERTHGLMAEAVNVSVVF